MADIHEEIRSLTELVDEVTKVSIMLRGTQAQPGLIQQLHEATSAAESMLDRLGPVHGLTEKVDGLHDQFEKLPERVFSKADSLGFRTVVARIMTEETENSIEKLQDVNLDRLDDEITHRMDRLADDLFGRKIEPSLKNLEAISRLKQEREDYKGRADKAEKALSDFQALSQKIEQSIIDQIERIRLSSKKPNRLAATVIFAAGWACAVFAAEFWSVITAWLVQQPIPAWFLPRSF